MMQMLRIVLKMVKAKISSNKPAVIVLDVMFPGQQNAGFELCRKVKNDDATKDIKVLMYSAVGDKYHMHFSTDDEFNPADAFIDKPISPQVLVKTIEELLS